MALGLCERAMARVTPATFDNVWPPAHAPLALRLAVWGSAGRREARPAGPCLRGILRRDFHQNLCA